MSAGKLVNHWKLAKNVEQCRHLIDLGIVLPWADAKRLNKNLSDDEQKQLMQHLADRFSEQHDTRLPEELVMEGVLGWLSNANSEKSMQYFLESVLSQPNATEATLKLVEVALTVELTDLSHEEVIYSSAVALICELGLALRDLDLNYPGQVKDVAKILDHTATYLLSVSNTNNPYIRLSLLHYFGAGEAGVGNKDGFNKVLSRFGHTVLDHLFYLLFKKKTEAVALQFLLENLPYILEADHHAQRIVHETWKFYMLKYPERFSLFLNTFSAQFKEIPYERTLLSRKPFFQHLGALLRVTVEVNHKQLTQVILTCYAKFDGDRCRNEVLEALLQVDDLKKNIKDLLREMRTSENSQKVVDSAARFTASKRGRKPSFARVDGWLTLDQVNFLGAQPPQQIKAS